MKTLIVGAGLVLALGAPQRALANDTAAPGTVKNNNPPAANAVPPDNTGRNERDRSVTAVTPMDQSNDPKDVALTQQIRKVVVADDALSMNAHNVKIISANGVVTLRGPVDSSAEKAKIEAAAAKAAGATNVRNELEVTASR
jgi:hyperosmotically inducible protein